MEKRFIFLSLSLSGLLLSGWGGLPKIKNPLNSVTESISSSFNKDDSKDAAVDENTPVSYAFSGDYASEVKRINKQVEKEAEGKSELLVLAEKGSIYRSAALANIAAPESFTESNIEDLTAGQYYLQESLFAFDRAEELVNQHESTAGVRVGENITAAITNEASRDYTGRAYDKVMINTYKALNYMTLGNFDAARVEINRSLQRQRDAVDQNAMEIEKAQQQVEEGDDEKVSRVRADPKASEALTKIEEDVQSRILQTYGDYVNPFAVFLDGLYFLYAGQDGSDMERARKSLERVAGMVPANTYIGDDLKAAESASPRQNVTYIIYETGRAPARGEEKIEIPAFLVTSSVSYVGAAFPKLEYYDQYDDSLVVTAEGKSHRSSVLCDMDSVISKDFQNEWPRVMRRSITSTLAKGGADATIQNASGSFGFAGQLLTKAATVAVQKKLNKADTRTWESLPKEFQYMCVPTPASGEVTISSGHSSQVVQLALSEVNVVHVKSETYDSPLLVSQFTFASASL